MLVPSYKLLFIHIPRTGGTSIETRFRIDLLKIQAPQEVYGKTCPAENAIYHLNNRQHYPIRFFDHIEDIDEYFKFSFIRNPFDRLVSVYEYSVLKKRYSFTQLVMLLPILSQRNKTFSPSIYCHLTPQHKFLNSDNHKVDVIGRFENLLEDFKNIALHNNLPVKELPHFFKTDRKPYPEYYNPITRKIVQFVYRRDLRLYGYRFDKQKS